MRCGKTIKQEEKMTSKQRILSVLKQNRRDGVEMPSFESLTPIEFTDKLGHFISMVQLVGGTPVILEEGAEIPSDSFASDSAVVQGAFGVAENGCVWVPQTMDERSVLFTPERLVIILDRNAILNNMHEAYSRIAGEDYDYGCFISGPSKTADIAQALVMGAQAARALVVYIR